MLLDLFSYLGLCASANGAKLWRTVAMLRCRNNALAAVRIATHLTGAPALFALLMSLQAVLPTMRSLVSARQPLFPVMATGIAQPAAVEFYLVNVNLHASETMGIEISSCGSASRSHGVF